MGVAKVRCSACGHYIGKELVFRQLGLSNFCSESCFNARWSQKSHRKPTPPRPPTTPKDPIPSLTRGRVLSRDAYCCRFCNARYSLHLHHIYYRSQGGSNDEQNLITLCTSCHAVVHSNKPRYQPLLLGVIWMTYHRRRFSVPMFERWYERNSRVGIRRIHQWH